jgi:hypothetical protein
MNTLSPSQLSISSEENTPLSPEGVVVSHQDIKQMMQQHHEQKRKCSEKTCFESDNDQEGQDSSDSADSTSKPKRRSSILKSLRAFFEPRDLNQLDPTIIGDAIAEYLQKLGDDKHKDNLEGQMQTGNPSKDDHDLEQHLQAGGAAGDIPACDEEEECKGEFHGQANEVRKSY